MIKDCLKRTFLYKLYRKREDKKRQARLAVLNDSFKKEAVDVLRLFSNALIEHNLTFWICAGTLLGYYREHDFIKHDFDLDTGAWFKDHECIKAVLENNGFERLRYYFLTTRDGIEECYKHRDYKTTIDVFYFFNEGNKSFHYSFIPLVSMTKKWHLNKVQPSKVRKWTYDKINPIAADFKGVKVFIPENPAMHLASTYGESFMTPIPNFPVEGRPNMIEYSYEELPACAFFKKGYFD